MREHTHIFSGMTIWYWITNWHVLLRKLGLVLSISYLPVFLYLGLKPCEISLSLLTCLLVLSMFSASCGETLWCRSDIPRKHSLTTACLFLWLLQLQSLCLLLCSVPWALGAGLAVKVSVGSVLYNSAFWLLVSTIFFIMWDIFPTLLLSHCVVTLVTFVFQFVYQVPLIF